MSLQRTPVSGAIVKQKIPFSASLFAAFAAEDYALPPLPSPLSGLIPAALASGAPALTLAGFAVRMQDDGAVVSLEIKNRVASGVAADVVKYRVLKLPASTDFTLALTPVPSNGSIFLAPTQLVLDVANTSTAQNRAAIAINDSASAAFSDGDYLVILATIPLAGLTVSPIAVDGQIEFFTVR
jgi:hypothetical protein